MITKTITHHICLFGILAILFAACQEDRDVEVAASVPIQEQPIVAVENGLLHFRDQSAWETTIQKMQGLEDYESYVTSLGFENSLRSKYDAIKESEELLEDYFKAGTLPNIQDDLFASLLNENAMVKIGQTLYRVTDEYTFSAVDEDGSMLKQFKENPASLNKLSEVSTFENIDHLSDKTSVIKGKDGKEVARFQGSSEVAFYKFNVVPGEYRVLAGAWSRTYGLYSSIGVKIICESYRKGGIFGKKAWRSRDADYLYCYGETETQECRPGGCVDIFAQGGTIKFKSHRAEKTLRSAPTGFPNVSVWHVTDYIEGDYQVRYEPGEPIDVWEWTFR